MGINAYTFFMVKNQALHPSEKYKAVVKADLAGQLWGLDRSKKANR